MIIIFDNEEYVVRGIGRGQDGAFVRQPARHERVIAHITHWIGGTNCVVRTKTHGNSRTLSASLTYRRKRHSCPK
ncbi:hypothetical protein E2C01_034015 [Portunus trituberculatus]|uniref:Uncharacterized protein n=1 Tax=Portunus trituberculatus TaxID=210409 RepID=A0A5B7F5N5_PORTR|nr:hypothetical protein [Portunus trituberculatus]